MPCDASLFAQTCSQHFPLSQTPAMSIFVKILQWVVSKTRWGRANKKTRHFNNNAHRGVTATFWPPQQRHNVNWLAVLDTNCSLIFPISTAQLVDSIRQIPIFILYIYTMDIKRLVRVTIGIIRRFQTSFLVTIILTTRANMNFLIWGMFLC
jgi:hypothetical protein